MVGTWDEEQATSSGQLHTATVGGTYKGGAKRGDSFTSNKYHKPVGGTLRWPMSESESEERD